MLIQVKPGVQEKKIVRRALKKGEELNVGENLADVLENGNLVVSRKVVRNEESSSNLRREGWKQDQEGNLSKQVYSKKTGVYSA